MPHILVIEDDLPLRRILARLLAFEGYEVSQAANGAEGLGLWRDAGADLVLTDIQMPEMNGIEVVYQLRALAPALPVVAMSGVETSASLRILHDAGLLGAVYVLQKPFRAGELLAALAAALRQRGSASRGEA